MSWRDEDVDAERTPEQIATAATAVTIGGIVAVAPLAIAYPILALSIAIGFVLTGVAAVASGGMNAGAIVVIGPLVSLAIWYTATRLVATGRIGKLVTILALLGLMAVAVFAMIQQGSHLDRLNHERIQREIEAGHRKG